jgi:dihydroorotate dehydrogenase
MTSQKVPLLLKIAPDMDDHHIEHIAKTLMDYAIDGVIATNTTLTQNAPGGISGKPVFERSTQVLKKLHSHLQGEIPLIGLGGIMSGKDAHTKMSAGADLVQLYTGLIYRGPYLIKECVHYDKL